MGDFKSIRPEELTDNVFNAVGSEWMLITAGPIGGYNTMTASWGGLGVLWNKNVAWCVVRPVRYTYEFMEKAENFTLSFFGEEYRDALNLCGTKSGRDGDKVAEAGLTPVAGSLAGTTHFEQARLVIACRKIYYQDLIPGQFLDPTIENLYPQKDYHRMYFGEIAGCLAK